MADDCGVPPESRATAYTTLAGPEFRHEIEVKRSRFITVLHRTGDEDSARAVLAGLRKEFHDARHHCSAFVLGPDRDVQRSNDDGEPSGTAGIPMLEALLKRETAPGVTDLSDVTAVVVRYFGGILLGAGGLVRAYSESVSAALDLAPLVRRRRLRICAVAVPHTAAGRLENDLRAAGYVMAETSYEAQTTVLRLALPDDPAGLAGAAERLAALTAGSAVLAARRNGVDRCPHQLSRLRPRRSARGRQRGGAGAAPDRRDPGRRRRRGDAAAGQRGRLELGADQLVPRIPPRRRAGLDGPARQKSWAISCDGQLAGSIRLRRTGRRDCWKPGSGWPGASAAGESAGRRFGWSRPRRARRRHGAGGRHHSRQRGGPGAAALGGRGTRAGADSGDAAVPVRARIPLR